MSMKNEHIVYAYAPLLDDGCLLLVGVTDTGWEYLKVEPGNFLKVTPPSGQQFTNVKNVWVVRGKDKADIRAMLHTIAKQMQVTLTEAN
jgi:hypothetical protein